MREKIPTVAPGQFCEGAWAAIADLRNAIRHHPFNEKLASGDLERDRFVFYLVQDARYLTGFSRALAMASTRAPNATDAIFLLQSSQTALVVERALHASYLERYGVTGEAEEIPTSPSCLAYTSYLQAVASTEPFPIVAAALLPCFWIYLDVGTSIHVQTATDPAHPYRDWIDTYAGDGFAASVATMRDLTHRAASAAPPTERDAMLRAFCRASEYEWMFWDSAWRKEGWPTAAWLAK